METSRRASVALFAGMVGATLPGAACQPVDRPEKVTAAIAPAGAARTGEDVPELMDQPSNERDQRSEETFPVIDGVDSSASTQEQGSGGATSNAGGGSVQSGSALEVSGRVIDFFRRPVPNVLVRIGEATTRTDGQGLFSISNVSSPYAAALLVNTTHYERPTRYGYVYQGLTRSDPTLQVYEGLPERQTRLTVSLANADFTLANRSVFFAFTSPDARFAALLDSTATDLGSMGWTGGPTTTTGAAHALMLLTSGVSGSIPTAYESYQSSTLAVSDGAAATALLDMSAPSLLTASTLGGNVSGGTLGFRKNFVSLRFADGAALAFINDGSAVEGAFSYLVPSVPGSSLIFAAADGLGAPDAYTVIHQENLVPGQTDLVLAVPPPTSLSAPAPGATASAGAVFSWGADTDQGAHGFVWHLQFSDNFDQLFVVTTRTSIELPEFADGSTWLPGSAAAWSVQSHGDAAGVDVLSGPDGFMDSFSYAFSSSEGVPVGPNRRDGYFTESEQRYVTLVDAPTSPAMVHLRSPRPLDTQ